MSLKKLANGSWQVYTFESSGVKGVKGKKVYRGVRATQREAKQFERELLLNGTSNTGTPTVAEYAARWLDTRHGPGTRRPSPGTRQVNAGNIRLFVDQHGHRPLDSFKRREALDWSSLHQTRAKSVSAMFNDAVDDELVQANPFANRRQPEKRGRRDIHPLTETEVDTLADIALDRWGRDGYGLIARAWVLFSAWVGTRPGETFRLRWQDLDTRDGLATVKRIKPPYNTDTIVIPSVALDAINGMPRMGDVVFPGIRGREMHHTGGHRYYWDPVRSAFRVTVTPGRWADLCEGQDDLDLYAARHFCASIIVERGGNEYDVSAQLGNTPEVARQTYVHAYEDRQRDRLRGLLERPAPVTVLDRKRRGA
jgi:integrase